MTRQHWRRPFFVLFVNANMLPTTLPGVLPSIPQNEIQLPSLRDIDPKRKRKTNKQVLPTLGSSGGKNAKTSRGAQKGNGRSDDFTAGISKLIGINGDASDKKQASKAAYSKGSLEELIAVAKTIEEECLVNPDDKDSEKDLDPFFKCKSVIVRVVEETRDLIEQRRRILETKGTTYEAIAKRSAIADNMAYLKRKFQELGDIYAQQYKHRKALKLSEEELDDRHKQLNDVLRDIELVHKLSKGGAGIPKGAFERGPAVALADLIGREPAQEDGWVSRAGLEPQPDEITEEDQIVLQRWKERDKQFDEQVAQIGDAIDRIADVAVTIGEQADKQSYVVEELTQQTDQAAAQLQLLDSKIKKFMKQQSASNFCCKLILLLIVMLLICFVFSTVYARYIKKA